MRHIKNSRYRTINKRTATMNILTSIETHGYAVNDAQIETLANARYASGLQMTGIDGTYLRVLVAAVRTRLGPKKGRRPSVDAQRQAIEEVNARFYAAVLRGVTTADVVPDPTASEDEQHRRAIERNRRSTFARSAKATLSAYVGAGGDIRGLTPKTVTKAALRAFVAGKSTSQVTAEVALGRAQEAVLRLIREEAAEHPDTARERLGAMIETLVEELSSLPPSAPPVNHQLSTYVTGLTDHRPLSVLRRVAHAA